MHSPSAGADVTQEPHYPLPSMLDLATLNGGDGEVVKLILERGADVNLRDKNGKTALEYAAGDSESSQKRVAVLKQYGAKK